MEDIKEKKSIKKEIRQEKENDQERKDNALKYK